MECFVDDFDLIPDPSEDEYTDSERLDEMACVDDYNRWEEEQVFQDQEWESPDPDGSEEYEA